MFSRPGLALQVRLDLRGRLGEYPLAVALKLRGDLAKSYAFEPVRSGR
jgi:hypothetical protein